MRIHTGRILARCAPIVAAFALAAQAMSAAAAWPERPIRLIVPFAPGDRKSVV